MFRRTDFKKLELFGNGKKNTRVFKVKHIKTGKIYVLKEVEAHSLDKLNEYKEEAVQLSKVQNHPNVLQFYGYYFYETPHNTYKLGIISESINRELNLESIYRKRSKTRQYFSENELLIIFYSLIDAFAYLESVGICHRDIKPTNLFLLENFQVKVIDFGESKEFIDEDDEEDEHSAMATIRGTPQYLSPILWEAHVISQIKHVEHNMFKSDVFSAGLVLFQMTALKDVNGFNQKTDNCNGERLIYEGLKMLGKKYSNRIIEILGLMLKFDENERPNFIELEKYLAKNKDYMPRADMTLIQYLEQKKANKSNKYLQNNISKNSNNNNDENNNLTNNKNNINNNINNNNINNNINNTIKSKIKDNDYDEEYEELFHPKNNIRNNYNNINNNNQLNASVYSNSVYNIINNIDDYDNLINGLNQPKYNRIEKKRIIHHPRKSQKSYLDNNIIENSISNNSAFILAPMKDIPITNISFRARMKYFSDKKKQNLEKMIKNKKEEEKQIYTFHPKTGINKLNVIKYDNCLNTENNINNNRKRMPDYNRINNLYLDYKDKRAKLDELTNEYFKKAGISFTPQINDKNKEIKEFKNKIGQIPYLDRIDIYNAGKSNFKNDNLGFIPTELY